MRWRLLPNHRRTDDRPHPAPRRGTPRSSPTPWSEWASSPERSIARSRRCRNSIGRLAISFAKPSASWRGSLDSPELFNLPPRSPTVIACTKCGKTNAGQSSFCLACGTPLHPEKPGESRQPALLPSLSSERGPPATERPRRPGHCPQCGADNPPANRFCASCARQLRVNTVDRLTSGGTKTRARPLDIVTPEPAPTPPLLAMLHADGTVAATLPIAAEGCRVGRSLGARYAGDHFLSHHHCSLSVTAGPTMGEVQVRVKDDDSLNGVFVKLAPEVPYALTPNQIFRIGQQLIRFETLASMPPDEHGVEHFGTELAGYAGRIVMVLGRKSTGTAFPVPAAGLQLGRERGQVRYPDDAFISGAHCRLSSDDGRVYLTDMGSSNGTFVRIRGELELAIGDTLLLGQQLYRIQASR
ncbi:MAG: FHA domain-containing protein [Myxococcales bacterium]|nr:FHA domain-containing protein [Myxococcales bacterium]